MNENAKIDTTKIEIKSVDTSEYEAMAGHINVLSVSLSRGNSSLGNPSYAEEILVNNKVEEKTAALIVQLAILGHTVIYDVSTLVFTVEQPVKRENHSVKIHKLS